MGEDISIPVQLPLDSDGFLRRECPNCEQEFKWYHHQEDDPDAERVDQCHCPRCGVAAAPDSWWTPDQLAYMQSAAAPEIERAIGDALRDAFRGVKGVKVSPNRNLRLDVDNPGQLTEPDDMVIVEPPCHPNEPLKVPDEATSQVHCLVCGAAFAA